MPAQWRFRSPGPINTQAMNACNSLVHTIASQSESSWGIFELFKSKFGGSGWSSSESWAIGDLHSLMAAMADNAPAFIAAFWDGCEEVRGQYPEVGLPDVDIVNGILFDHGVPYEIRPRSLWTSYGLWTPESAWGSRHAWCACHSNLIDPLIFNGTCFWTNCRASKR